MTRIRQDKRSIRAGTGERELHMTLDSIKQFIIDLLQDVKKPQEESSFLNN